MSFWLTRPKFCNRFCSTGVSVLPDSWWAVLSDVLLPGAVAGARSASDHLSHRVPPIVTTVRCQLIRATPKNGRKKERDWASGRRGPVDIWRLRFIVSRSGCKSYFSRSQHTLLGITGCAIKIYSSKGSVFSKTIS